MLEGWDVMGLADAINILSATLLLVPVRTVLTFSSFFPEDMAHSNGRMLCVSDLLAGRAGQSELGSRPRPGGAGIRSYEQWRPVMASDGKYVMVSRGMGSIDRHCKIAQWFAFLLMGPKT
jgi:hypothetical protein